MATYKLSLGPFFGSKEKKPLNPLILKTLNTNTETLILAKFYTLSFTAEGAGLKKIDKIGGVP